MFNSIKHHAIHSKIKFAIPLSALIAIILLFLGSHDTVNGSVMKPQSDIDLSAQFSSGTPEGVWSDGSTIWVVDNDSRRLVAYNRSTGDYLADKTIQLVRLQRRPPRYLVHRQHDMGIGLGRHQVVRLRPLNREPPGEFGH